MLKNKKVILLLTAIVAIVGIAFYYGGPRSTQDTPTLSIKSGDSEHRFFIEIADTPLTRSQGLSGRSSLNENEGMLFLFEAPETYSFWMKDMLFPIDIVWIRGERIVGFSEHAQPEPGKSLTALTMYWPPEPVDTVLEINAGLIEKYNIRIGDRIDFATPDSPTYNDK